VAPRYRGCGAVIACAVRSLLDGKTRKWAGAQRRVPQIPRIKVGWDPEAAAKYSNEALDYSDNGDRVGGRHSKQSDGPYLGNLRY